MAMLERTTSTARMSFAVDDDTTVLEAAQAVGLHGVLVDREGRSGSRQGPWTFRLGDLAGLPAVVAAVTGGSLAR
jgi:FMN phosphatase YigB (HAD superfamily)